MELTEYYHAHRLMGRADFRNATPPGELYWVDERFCVLGQHATPHAGCEGKLLFELLPFSRNLCKRAQEALLVPDGASLLLPTRQGVLLFMGDTPFCTGATLVIRPPQGIRESLAYAGGFLHLLPHLTTHPEAPLKSEYRSAAGERLAVEWYHRVSRAFYFGKVSSGDELRHVISARLERMAELLGVCVEFDLCGIILRAGERIEWGLFTAALIAAMLSAARISPTGELRIWLLRAENGDPLLQAEIGCGAPDALPELAPLRRAATLRGTVCESFYMEEAHCMVLRASLCYVPLEKQDVKEQLPKLSRLLSYLEKQRSKSIPRELREAALELHFDEEG